MDGMWNAEEVRDECKNGIRDGTRKGRGRSYAGVQEVWRECQGVEWRAWSAVDELQKTAA